MANERKIDTIEIDRLYDFLDSLQASGYVIDPRQYLSLSDLLMVLVARGERIEELELKTLIAPLICSTPFEQQDFYQRFDSWFPTLFPVKQARLSGEEIAIPPQPKRRLSALVINRTAFIWLTITITMIALIFSWISNSTTLQIKINGNVLLYSGIVIFICLLSWLGWRLWILYHENQFITRELANQDPIYTKIPVKAYIQEVIPIIQFKPIVSSLRRRIQVPSNEVDVNRTIESALYRVNWLEIIYRQRQLMPEYVVLIDRKSRLDQQARFVQEVLAKLTADGVWLHSYEFSGDPRICFPLDQKDLPLRLKDLKARHSDARLLVFSSTHELINPLTSFLSDWIDSLSHWSKRAILTSDNLQKVLLEELLSRDFAVLPMTFEGLASLVRAFEMDNVLSTTNGRLSLPSQLTERPIRWTGRDAPPEAEISDLVSDVKNYLGENGFYWLCATAVYPELSWELTLFLGGALKDNQEKPLLNLDILLRLIHLPWFRYGYMPDWIRLVLINSFTADQEDSTRDILSELLSTAFNGEDFNLTFSRRKSNSISDRTRLLLKALIRNSTNGRELKDQLFVKFILKPEVRKLSVALTIELRKRFSRIRLGSPLTRINAPEFFSTIASGINNFIDRLPHIIRRETQINPNERVKLFLAHAAADKSKVREIYEKLESLNWIDPWIAEQRLIAGQNWNSEIDRALTGSDAVIIFLSNNSVSKSGYIQKEIRLALDRNDELPEGTQYLILARLEKCNIPYRLTKYQPIDLFEDSGIDNLISLLIKKRNQIRHGSYFVRQPYNQIENNLNADSKDKDKPILRVLVSHSPSDGLKATNLYQYLKRWSIDVRFDEKGLLSDKVWNTEFPAAIKNLDAVIICLSKNSANDQAFYKIIKLCLEAAQEKTDEDIFIIPVRLDECDVPYSLRGYQWLDLFIQSDYEKLISAIRFRANQLDRKPVVVVTNKGLNKYEGSTPDEFGTALINLERAIELDPANSKPYLSLGSLYVERKEYDAALQNFTKAIELDPSNIASYLMRGHLYNEIKEFEKALVDFSRALELDPTNIEAYLNLSNIYLLEKKYEAAVAEISKAIELDSTNANAYLNRGTIFADMERFNDAIVDLDSAIKIDSSNANFYLNRSKLLMALGRNQDALADLTKASQLDIKYLDLLQDFKNNQAESEQEAEKKAAGEIINENALRGALIDLAHYLPDNLKPHTLQEALSAARELTDEDARARALGSLAQYLPENLKPQALSAAREITDADARARALGSLAQYLPEDIKPQAINEALIAAQQINDGDARARALSHLAKDLPENFKPQAPNPSHERAEQDTLLEEALVMLEDFEFKKANLILTHILAEEKDERRLAVLKERLAPKLKLIDDAIINTPLFQTEYDRALVLQNGHEAEQLDALRIFSYLGGLANEKFLLDLPDFVPTLRTVDARNAAAELGNTLRVKCLYPLQKAYQSDRRRKLDIDKLQHFANLARILREGKLIYSDEERSVVSWAESEWDKYQLKTKASVQNRDFRQTSHDSIRETGIALWGPSGSGKDWLIRGFAKELEFYNRTDNDFSYELYDDDNLPIIPEPPEVRPTAVPEDFILKFVRRPKSLKPDHSHLISAQEHDIVIHNFSGAQTVAAAVDQSGFEETYLSIVNSNFIIMTLDPTIITRSYSQNNMEADISDRESATDNSIDKTGSPENVIKTSYKANEYARIIEYLFMSLTKHSNQKRYLAICLTKMDEYEMRGDPWDLVIRLFGKSMYDLFDKYQRVFEIRIFPTSAVGFSKNKRNMREESGQLRDPGNWQPVNTASPFFWIFENIEKDKLRSRKNLFNNDLQYYIEYPIRKI